MARKKTPDRPSLRFDKFVESVRPDPKSTPILTILHGYIGKSSEVNCVRLYREASLNDFIEIPQDAILHAESNSVEENPLGGSKIWVKADTVYMFGDPNNTQRLKGSFLQGPLYDSYVRNPQLPPINPGPTNDPGCTQGNDCMTMYFECPPSEYETACKSVLYVCPTKLGYTCNLGCFDCTKQETNCNPLPTQGGKSICFMDTCYIGCFDCTKQETNCNPIPTKGGKSICFIDTCHIGCFETQYKGCTDYPDCPNGQTCVKTCKEDICFGKTNPKTCNSPTIQGSACKTGGTFRNPGYGFGTFNPYQS